MAAFREQLSLTPMPSAREAALTAVQTQGSSSAPSGTDVSPGNISKNCTSDGWSETFPDFIDACGYSDPEDESKVGSHVVLRWSGSAS
ncbi:hypothetical protein P7K49_026166 [Saguinus oedipus]|uniref:Uncharacterized protein n=1 Tax=Saguinus oedipus TaxID=9490 RepID=A0ABQ9ULK2_SAGOE|nr:hypothetical protein P7K49_026166 [Saguinus oedipus]